jgi:hypothetical protein
MFISENREGGGGDRRKSWRNLSKSQNHCSTEKNPSVQDSGPNITPTKDVILDVVPLGKGRGNEVEM